MNNPTYVKCDFCQKTVEASKAGWTATQVRCDYCAGSETCPDCNGTGSNESGQDKCPECKGKKRIKK